MSDTTIVDGVDGRRGPEPACRTSAPTRDPLPLLGAGGGLVIVGVGIAAASRPRHKSGRLVVLVIVVAIAIAIVAGAGWLAWQAKAELRALSGTCNR